MLSDFRYGLRTLRASPGLTAVAVLSLALGIGANSTIFSLIDGLFLRPPVKDGAGLVRVFSSGEREQQGLVAWADFQDFQQQSTSFRDLLACARAGETLVDPSGDGQAELIMGGKATGNFFSLLGVRPLLGRDFLPRNVGRAPVR